MAHPKFTYIAAAPSSKANTDHYLYALDADGGVWWYSTQVLSWVRVTDARFMPVDEYSLPQEHT